MLQELTHIVYVSVVSHLIAVRANINAEHKVIKSGALKKLGGKNKDKWEEREFVLTEQGAPSLPCHCHQRAPSHNMHARACDLSTPC